MLSTDMILQHKCIYDEPTITAKDLMLKSLQDKWLLCMKKKTFISRLNPSWSPVETVFKYSIILSRSQSVINKLEDTKFEIMRLRTGTHVLNQCLLYVCGRLVSYQYFFFIASRILSTDCPVVLHWPSLSASTRLIIQGRGHETVSFEGLSFDGKRTGLRASLSQR